MRTAQELRADLKAQRERLKQQAEERALVKSQAQEALSDLYFLGVPASEIARGAGVTREFLNEVFRSIKLHGEQVEAEEQAQSSSRRRSSLAHHEVVAALPHNSKTRFGADRWSENMNFALTDSESESAAESDAGGMSQSPNAASVEEAADTGLQDELDRLAERRRELRDKMLAAEKNHKKLSDSIRLQQKRLAQIAKLEQDYATELEELGKVEQETLAAKRHKPGSLDNGTGQDPSSSESDLQMPSVEALQVDSELTALEPVLEPVFKSASEPAIEGLSEPSISEPAQDLRPSSVSEGASEPASEPAFEHAHSSTTLAVSGENTAETDLVGGEHMEVDNERPLMPGNEKQETRVHDRSVEPESRDASASPELEAEDMREGSLEESPLFIDASPATETLAEAHPAKVLELAQDGAEEYTSPLRLFARYRFSPLFIRGDVARVFSSTYNGSLVESLSSRLYCQTEAGGVECTDPLCPDVHERDFAVSHDKALRSVITQGTADSEVRSLFLARLKEAGGEIAPTQVAALVLEARSGRTL